MSENDMDCGPGDVRTMPPPDPKARRYDSYTDVRGLPRNPVLNTTAKRINAAYGRIRQARLDAGVAPGEPLLWPNGLPDPSTPENVETSND